MIKPVGMSSVSFGKYMRINKLIVDNYETSDLREIKVAADGLQDILQKRVRRDDYTPINPDHNEMHKTEMEKGESIRTRLAEETHDYISPEKPLHGFRFEDSPAEYYICDDMQYLVTGEEAKQLQKDKWNILDLQRACVGSDRIKMEKQKTHDRIKKEIEEPGMLFNKGLVLYGTRVPYTGLSSQPDPTETTVVIKDIDFEPLPKYLK